MKKQSPLSTMMSYWPLITALVGLVGFCYTLKIGLANAEDDIKQHSDWLIKQSSSNQELKIAQSRMEEKVNGTYSILQELRADLKEQSRRGR